MQRPHWQRRQAARRPTADVPSRRSRPLGTAWRTSCPSEHSSADPGIRTFWSRRRRSRQRHGGRLLGRPGPMTFQPGAGDASSGGDGAARTPSDRFVAMSAPGLDPTFSDLPHRRLGEVALARAQELGASHADFRFERNRYQYLGARDGVLQTASDAEDLGFAVRVVHQGAWGFASGVVLTDDEARRVAETAVAVARVAATMTTTPVELAPEPVHDDVTWVSGYDINPLDVPTPEKGALLVDWTERLRTGAAVAHATAFLQQVQENKYYADLSGTRTTQQRVRLQPGFEATGEDAETGIFDSMASIAPPVGRGWEYLTGAHWDWETELAEVPELLAEKLKAPTVEAGTYDLVVHPSNLWLTIHESIGHATELDRALGYEANYAGTSF